MNVKNLASLLFGFLLVVTPAFAQNPIETLVLNLKAAGFQLVLLWLLTLAIVYGILSHVEIPKSISARGVISIVSAFMVLLAAAGTQAANFISNLITSSVLVAFGLLMTMIFLEITGTKSAGEHVFAKHPRFFASAIIILGILIFIGAGGLTILHLPHIVLSDPLIALIFFLIVMITSIWILVKETEKK